MNKNGRQKEEAKRRIFNKKNKLIFKTKYKSIFRHQSIYAGEPRF